MKPKRKTRQTAAGSLMEREARRKKAKAGRVAMASENLDSSRRLGGSKQTGACQADHKGQSTRSIHVRYRQHYTAVERQTIYKAGAVFMQRGDKGRCFAISG